MSQPPDPYRILHVPPTADAAQIRQMYRLLAKRYHPDLVPPERRAWALERMATLNVAYEALSDPQRRAETDRLRGYTQEPRADATWLHKRTRERRRRQQAARWRNIGRVGLILFGAGLLVTILVVREPLHVLIAALFDSALLGLLLVSLVMANR